MPLELTAVTKRIAKPATNLSVRCSGAQGLNVQRLKLVNSTLDVHISEQCGGHSQSAFSLRQWALRARRSLDRPGAAAAAARLACYALDRLLWPLDVWHAAKTLQRGAVLSCADRRPLWARRDWASLEALPSTLCPRYCLFNKKVAAHDGSTTGSSKQTYANEYCVRAAHLAAHGLVTLETSPWDAASCRPPVFGRSWAGTAAANATKFVPGARSVDWCDLQTARWPTEAGGSCTGGFCVPPVPLQPRRTPSARGFRRMILHMKVLVTARFLRSRSPPGANIVVSVLFIATESAMRRALLLTTIIAVSPAHALSATPAVGQSANIGKLLSWFVDEKRGEVSDAITVGESPMGIGPGLLAARDVNAGECIMTVPGSACMSALDAVEDPDIGEAARLCLWYFGYSTGTGAEPAAPLAMARAENSRTAVGPPPTTAVGAKRRR